MKGRPNENHSALVCGVDGWSRAAVRVKGFNPEAFLGAADLPITVPNRERGLVYKTSIINKAREKGIFACANVMEVALDMSDEFEASIEKADSARQKLIDSFKEFRGEVKNDISSITAAGDRVREESRKIHMALENVSKLMNSTEMIKGLENVERLVTALRAMQELQGTKIAFALMNQETPVTAYAELSEGERDGWRTAIKATVGA